LFAHNGVQRILCCVVLSFCFVFLRFVYPMFPVFFLDCPILIVPSEFSNVYYI